VTLLIPPDTGLQLLYKKNPMHKILLTQDARHLNMSSVEFACYLARLTKSKLTGVFLEDVLADHPEWAASAAYGVPVSGHTLPDAVEAKTESAAEENIRIFREACVCREVVSRVHRDRGIPLAEMLEESRFADLIVADPEISFRERPAPPPAPFVTDMLADAECPVVLSPASYDRIDEIIFAYNGTAAAVWAIKQFTYLFPEYREKKVSVVSVREGDDNSMEESYKIKEWLREHYQDVEFHLLQGNSTDQLFGYLLERKNAFVVMGAYGRGLLSRFFRPSHARLIVRTLNLPIFIAHP